MNCRPPLAGLVALSLFSATARAQESPPSAPAALREGGQVEFTLSAGQTRAIPLETSPDDYVRGRLDGAAAHLSILDGSGTRLRGLVAPGGPRREFQFVAGDRGPYALELRAESEGTVTLRIESLVPRSAQKAPKEVLESPRLRELEQSLAAGGTTDAFWNEVAKNQGPLIEREGVTPPLEKGTSLVTFLWRGATRNVRLFGAPSNDFDPLRRLGESDVWFGSYRVPNDTRVTYKLAPDVPELDAPAPIRRRAILATAQRDPFNPRHVPSAAPSDVFAGESLLELPDAPRSPWLERRPGVPAGTIEHHQVRSSILNNQRDVALYRPPGYDPGARGNALLVVFDGVRYISDIETPTILDNLIAAKAIPPTAAVFISNASDDSRGVELPPNPQFARFLAEELMSWARGQNLHAPASKTVIVGASYGGLAAAYAGWTHPELFGNVLSQSGSFWWAPEPATGAQPGPREAEPAWLTRQIAAAPLRPVTFYLEAGRQEVGRGGTPGILDTTRHLRDVLVAKGYPVHHAEYSGGHGYAYWHFTLADGLLALLGPPSGR